MSTARKSTTEAVANVVSATAGGVLMGWLFAIASAHTTGWVSTTTHVFSVINYGLSAFIIAVVAFMLGWGFVGAIARKVHA